MIAAIATLESAGAYSAGYRIMDVAMVPLQSMLATVLPRIYRSGEDGVGAATRYVFKIIPFALFFALLLCGALYVFSGIVPWVLGAEYSVAASVLKWMLWLPVLVTLRWYLQSILSSCDKQRLTVIVLMAGAAMNVLLNFFTIPRWGWEGAVLATYLSEVFMLVSIAFYLLRDLRGKSRVGE
jgi:O-antigen/teichoic acid export membrane protein